MTVLLNIKRPAPLGHSVSLYALLPGAFWTQAVYKGYSLIFFFFPPQLKKEGKIRFLWFSWEQIHFYNWKKWLLYCIWKLVYGTNFGIVIWVLWVFCNSCSTGLSKAYWTLLFSCGIQTSTTVVNAECKLRLF